MKNLKLTKTKRSPYGNCPSKNGWIDYLIVNCEPTENSHVRYINWLYKLSGLKKPMIIFLSSPLGIQYGANMLKSDGCGIRLRAQVRDPGWRLRFGIRLGIRLRIRFGIRLGDQV